MNVTTTTVFENVPSPFQLPSEVPSPMLFELPGEGPKVAQTKPRLTAAPPVKEPKVFTKNQVPPVPKMDARVTKQSNTTMAYRPKGLNSTEDKPFIFHLDDINAKHQGSTDSDCESIFDPEPDFEDRFPAEVYSELIAGLQQEVQRELQAGNFQQAEQSQRRAMEYLTDRERKLGISFDNKTEMNEILAEIYQKQKQLNKAKQALNRLLMQEKGETERKWRLYHSLAKIYHEQDRLPEAEKFAKRAYIGREKTLEKDDLLLLNSVNLLIAIYEREHKMETAEALRRVYRTESAPPEVPPKSKQRDLAIQDPQDEVTQVPTRSRVRWAPDAWTDSSSINAPTKSGETPLVSAISTGDEELVRLMLQRGADVEARCADQITPLMHAMIHESRPIMELLLEKGAQIDATTAGWTVLHRAAAMIDVPLVKLLLAKGADIEARSPKDFVPNKNPLARMSTSDIDEYDEVDASDADRGWTALLRAATNGDEVIVRLLLDKGADIEARSPSNGTSLICAAERQHEAIVDILLQHGANVNAEDDFGWKPLHRALVHRGGERVAQMLLTHGADVDARCAYQRTPLHHAIEKSNDSMVSFLLNAGADFEARDVADRTPLFTAIESRLEIMVRILLDAGADTDAMDRGGRDALAAANHALRRSPEIIGLLAKHKKAKKGSVGGGGHGRSGSLVSRQSSSSSWWSMKKKR
ncbi:hypothetical protein P7C71_g2097, partial [Lecanoromycetidae sp. Uapishka_2]